MEKILFCIHFTLTDTKTKLHFFKAFQSTVFLALWVNPRSSFVMGILVWWLWTPFFTSLISFYEVEPGSTQRWENQSLNVCPLGYLWPQSGMSTMLHLPSPSAWINKATHSDLKSKTELKKPPFWGKSELQKVTQKKCATFMLDLEMYALFS